MSWNKFTYENKNDKTYIVPPQLSSTGSGALIGSTAGEFLANKYMPKPMQDTYIGSLARNTASVAGGYVGNVAEKCINHTFYAEERLYADAYNKEISRGGSVEDAKFWGNQMSGK